MRAAKLSAGRWIGLIALGTFPFVIHMTLILVRSSILGAVLFWTELAVMTAVSLVCFKHRRVWALLLLAIVAVVQVFRSATGDAAVAASGIPHAVAYIGLLTVFGNSLLRGRTPLISSVSQKLSGEPLPPEIARYTRNVTIAWCGFFCLQLIGSLALILWASVATWSLFVNILNIPFIVAMFLGEYAYRRLRFRNYRHRTILQVVWAFTDGDMLSSRPAGGHGPDKSRS